MFEAFIFLLAAVIAVPIARRLGLGSVLGYLVAGAVIGPYALALVGSDIEEVMHFSELGVVMMLFLIGLEMEPAKLWRMRLPILGMGAAQVFSTAAALVALALAFGLGWREALAIGFILALSSTAFVLQMLSEKGLLKTEGGRSAFSVLLFQDIAVIPMLALLPLLAEHAIDDGENYFHEGLSGWHHTLVVAAVIIGIILAGRFLVRPLFNMVASAQMRELFIATALLLVTGITLLMEQVGLSAALGTFLAGVVLADSEYRHVLEAEIDPFKSLLLGLFFITVGASMDFHLLADRPLDIALLVTALIGIKVIVLLVIGNVFALARDQRWLFSLALAQGGEFAFVLFAFATSLSVIPEAMASTLILAVALSMAITPLLMLFYELWLRPRLISQSGEERPSADTIDDGATPVIICGFGRVGQIIGRLLRTSGFQVTVLDHSVEQVELVRRFGHKVFFGDASRPELLEAAGIRDARLLVLALADPDSTLQIAQYARKHCTHLTIMARAIGRREAQKLLRAGVDVVVRDTFHSAMQLGQQALQFLGLDEAQSREKADTFRSMDEAHLLQLVDFVDDEKEYINRSRQNSLELERVLRAEAEEAAN
ncbi:monovalent cation:proton antiporter-2 (CPA2) family protein [Haliea sp. E17]|uniref:monovalent cation:proton antiporter-2 (CPA2) family protein n=1 Tax=Haliea sp. E17 TaxID=3401576 RepID=UPI003AAFBF7D